MPISVGIDVGGTKILGIAVEDTGRRVGDEVRRPTPRGTDALYDAIFGFIRAVREDGKIDVGLDRAGFHR